MTQVGYQYFQPEQFARLSNLNVLARKMVEGFVTGLHRSRHHGFSVEFAEHREYAPGDDVRHLDYVTWARTDRYYIKQYEQHTNLRAHILLDTSGSMAYSYGDAPSKFTYGAYLAACLAYLMARQQDLVGLVAFDEQVRQQIGPGSTPAHLDRIFRALERVQPTGQTALAETCHHLAQTIAKRGLIVVISDFYDDTDAVLNALQHFVYKKHQVIVFHVLDPSELALPFRTITSFVDMETRRRVQVDPRAVRQAYRRAVDEFVGRYRRECSDRRIEYVLTPTDTPYDRMLLSYLSRRKGSRT